MVLSKTFKIRKFKNEIKKICMDNSFEISSDLDKAFVIRTCEKIYNVSIISTYRFKNSGIKFISDKEAHLWSQIPLIKGFGGSISFPLYKTVRLSDIDESEKVENVCVVYPKCMTLQVVEHENKYASWIPGKKIGKLRVFDGDSLKNELKNPGLYTDEKESKHSAVVSAVGI